MRSVYALLLVVLAAISFSTFAAETAVPAAVSASPAPSAGRPTVPQKLPKKLIGEWSREPITAGRSFGGSVRLEIISEADDGSFEALLSMDGTGRRCSVKNAPISGKNNGNSIIMQGMAGTCGAGTFDLKKQSGDAYEGSYTLDNGLSGDRKMVLGISR